MASQQSTYIWKKAGEAENYSASRPEHPSDVVNLSLKYLREKYQGPLQLALDIGCGTGKSTEHLLPHFEKVYGCDLSQAMLDQAIKDYGDKNVTFLQSTAEDLSQFPSDSFQLVIAGRCIHYFDTVKFFAEVDRLLKPGGILVYYTLQFEVLNAMQGDDKTEILTGIYDEYLEKEVGDYFSQPPYLPEGFKLKGKNRKEWYLDILRPPYGERKTEIMKTYRVLTLATLRNLLVSYSPTLRFREIHGDAKTEELLDKCISDLKIALEQQSQDSDKIEVQAMNELFIVMTRKPN